MSVDEDVSPARPALLLRVGQPPEVDLDFSTELEAYQKFVGGPIEVVHLSRDVVRALEERFHLKLGKRPVMVVHEDGMLEGLPLNELASRLRGAPIVGDVLIQDVS